MEDLKVVVNGTGAAGVACTKIIMSAGVRNVVGCDQTGALYRGRSENMNWVKDHYTRLTNPDFAALAQAYGGHGETVSRTEGFPAAFERALASGKTALIQLMLDPDVTSPSTTLTALREKALASR